MDQRPGPVKAGILMGRRGMPAPMSPYRPVSPAAAERAFRLHARAHHRASPDVFPAHGFMSAGPADPVLACSAHNCPWMVDVRMW